MLDIDQANRLETNSPEFTFELSGQGELRKPLQFPHPFATQAGEYLVVPMNQNSNVDLLVGAVKVWCWDKDAVSLVKEMQAAGIERILWSNQQTLENLRALNDLGVLTSRYDIYQDVMNPQNFPLLRGTHPDWTTAAWPDDIILDARGNWLRGWAVKGKDDQWYSCGVLCDCRAVDYARARIWTNAPERVVKFQLGHSYRLPLWELVYHDCVVAQWYWGDYNNKLPMLWDKRDLFNLLYATPPMFMFNRELWAKNRARFVQSYQNTCPTVRDVGYSEMIDHRFLTPDRIVQQTAFANGTTVTVNFGNTPYRLPDRVTVPPMGYHVEKMKPF